MPTQTLSLVNNNCLSCSGSGTVHSGPKHDLEYDPIDCEDCNGTGNRFFEPYREDGCNHCGSKTPLRFLAIESREPHGETIRDEGYECLNCGAIAMDTDEPRHSVTSEDLMADLMRSIFLAKNLDPAFRMGVALAESKRQKGVA